MNRRQVLEGIAGAGVPTIAGVSMASAGDVHPNACPICPDDECPNVGLCKVCYEDRSYC